MGIVDWIENSTLGTWMIDSLWAYPIILSTHAIGMSIVVGTVVVIDLRLLGFAAAAPLDSFRKLFLVTWIGVVINFLSGVALYSSDPAKFTYHWVFWIKLSLMLMGVVFAVLMWRQIKMEPEIAKPGFESSFKIKILAWSSLLLWLGVIVTGRLIGYVDLG